MSVYLDIVCVCVEWECIHYGYVCLYVCILFSPHMQAPSNSPSVSATLSATFPTTDLSFIAYLQVTDTIWLRLDLSEGRIQYLGWKYNP